MRNALSGLLFVLFLSATCRCDDEAATFVVAGYLPSYRFESVPVDRAALLTDVVLFSVEPRADGTIDDQDLPAKVVRPLRDKFSEQGCRVLITIGGWGHSSAFGAVTADDDLRGRLVRGLADLCETHQLDGIDVDWEHPQDEQERAQLGQFLTELKAALEPQQRLVTIAVAPWEQLAPTTISAVDRVHLMAYDNGGRHSTPAYAEESIDRLLAAGVPAEKLCLGIPFYGRPMEGEFGSARTYAVICERHDLANDVDEVDGFYFNGRATVAAKVRLARERGLAGVMIWEIGQDSTEQGRSLLESIRQASGERSH